MEHNKQIPPEIYDLLQERSFSQLDPVQQALVIQWLSAAEYDRLRELEQDTIALFAADNEMQPQEELPDMLREAFRNKYPAPRKALPLLSRVIPLWQAAAAMLLMVAGTALIFMKRPVPPELALNLVRDTVYLAVNDTIYLSARTDEGGIPAQKTPPAHRQNITTNTQNTLTNTNAVTTGAETTKNISGVAIRAADMQLLPVTQKDEPLNTVTTRSMNDDSLLGHIGFVRF